MSSKSFQNASKLNGIVSVLQFGAVGDGVTDDSTAIQAALATGLPISFPKTNSGVYLISNSITTSTGTQITMDDGVVIHYTGSSGAGINLTGSKVSVVLGEIYAPSAPYAIKYYNLEYSEVKVRRPGNCTFACIYHDGTLQTSNAGNNRWTVEDIQAGSVPYGVYIKNSTTYILEGELWDVKVILSATNTAFKIGDNAASQLVRWNTYRMAIDAQGITPLLIDVYQNSNNIELINWAGLVSPPVAHVVFNTATGGNVLQVATGVQDPIKIQDNGINTSLASGQAGQRVFNGKLLINEEAAGITSSLFVGLTASAGDNVAIFENKSTANNTTKYAGLSLRGRATENSGKETAAIRATPQDADLVNSTLGLYGRRDDQVVGYAFFGINGTPEGQITAPPGAIATRREGSTGTTFYVKESGTGNTGWVAK
jgi:hypothetical protein